MLEALEQTLAQSHKNFDKHTKIQQQQLYLGFAELSNVDSATNTVSNLISAPCEDPALLKGCNVSCQAMETQGWWKGQKAQSTSDQYMTRKPPVSSESHLPRL